MPIETQCAIYERRRARGSIPRLRAGTIWRVGCTRGSFLNSGSRAGFGRVGCGLGGSAGFSAGFGESDEELNVYHSNRQLAQVDGSIGSTR